MKVDFTAIVGTGGIGTGVFYRLEGNHAIGREESRRAHRLDRRDACKQHIILHYLAVLLRDLSRPVKVVPIGAVGADEEGRALCAEMAAAGMRVDHVLQLSGTTTLSAVCFLFPDGSGGNFTESDSACERVTPAVIDRAWKALRPPQGRTMVLAAPEVPLEARHRLLERGRSAGAFNVASLVTAEVAPAMRQKFLDLVDLLALNRDEAAALARVPASSGSGVIADACARRLARRHPGLRLTVTVGPDGAFGVCGGQVRHFPALPAKVVNTAGAGDAFLSGVMLGEVLGLPFLDGDASCLHLGCALGSLKVTGSHTIHSGINLASLRQFLRQGGQQALWKGLR
jgi:sugar/nucleoside kinase (ribokinase family)